MRGRALVRFVIVFTLVAGMLLAPVVTWPSSGLPSDAAPIAPIAPPDAHLQEHAPR